MITIDPATEADYEPLVIAAGKDRHPVCLPTHIVRKGGEIVGYISFTPSYHAWIDTQRVNAFDTFRRVFPGADEIAKSFGCRSIFYLTGRQSNLTPFAERIGYKHLGSTELFVKQLIH